MQLVVVEYLINLRNYSNNPLVLAINNQQAKQNLAREYLKYLNFYETYPSRGPAASFHKPN